MVVIAGYVFVNNCIFRICVISNSATLFSAHSTYAMYTENSKWAQGQHSGEQGRCPTNVRHCFWLVFAPASRLFRYIPGSSATRERDKRKPKIKEMKGEGRNREQAMEKEGKNWWREREKYIDERGRGSVIKFVVPISGINNKSSEFFRRRMKIWRDRFLSR